MAIGLTVKQKKFVDIYAKSGNAIQSYIDAGYKATSRSVASDNAQHLLARAKIKDYLNELNAKIDDERIADIIEIKRFWTDIIRAKKGYETKDQLKASELLAKTAGAFLDRVEVTGTIRVLSPDERKQRIAELKKKLGV